MAVITKPDLSALFSCRRCSEIMTEGFLLSCGHSFDKECVFEIFKSENPTCPTCKKSLGQVVVQNLLIQEVAAKQFKNIALLDYTKVCFGSLKDSVSITPCGDIISEEAFDSILNHQILKRFCTRCHRIKDSKMPTIPNLLAREIGKRIEYDFFKSIHALANRGDAYGLNSVGILQEFGVGVERDRAKAFEFYKKAADSGSKKGQFNVAICYYKGKGVEQNFGEAVKYFKLSADQGFPSALYMMGAIYKEGKQGIPKNEAEAFRLLNLAARQGEQNAINELGVMYDKGIFVSKDDAVAFYYFKKSADQGFYIGQYNLGLKYYCGEGVLRDTKKAFILFQTSANQGYAPAQNMLDRICKSGDHVDKGRRKSI